MQKLEINRKMKKDSCDCCGHDNPSIWVGYYAQFMCDSCIASTEEMHEEDDGDDE
jgi:hypothetical protein